MMKRLMLFFCTLILSVATYADVYKWVDADGKIHFGDSAPASAKVETLNLPSAPHTNQPDVSAQEVKQRQETLLKAMTEEREVKQKSAQQNAEKQAKLNKDCAKARDYLKNISSGRIYDLDKKGERVYANDAEHEKEVKQTENDIKKYCH